MRIVAALLVGALTGGAGCFRTHVIPVDELRKLDGLGVPQPPPPPPPPGQKLQRRQYRVLKAADGAVVQFDQGAELFLQSAGGAVGGRFSRILVTDTLFDGVLALGARPVQVELGSIQYAHVQTVDGVGTAAMVGGGLLIGLAGLYVFVLALNGQPTR